MAIYISHRLSSCVFCSRVAVFDKARFADAVGYDDVTVTFSLE